MFGGRFGLLVLLSAREAKKVAAHGQEDVVNVDAENYLDDKFYGAREALHVGGVPALEVVEPGINVHYNGGSKQIVEKHDKQCFPQ